MTFTSRGWWFLMLVLGLLVMGLVGPYGLYFLNYGLEDLRRWLPSRTADQFGLSESMGSRRFIRLGSVPVLVVLGFTLFFWFAWEWLLFALRGRVAVRGLRIRRLVQDEHGPVDSLWAGRTFRVRVEVRLDSALHLPFVVVADRIPFGTELASGVTHLQGALQADGVLRLDYRMHCPAAGRLRFDGVRVQLADLQGFFYKSAFVADPVEYRVLPVLVNEVGQPATRKRHNLLPPPGVHRLRKPGTGSELLDLRDYLPGDPPKTIAWKVSARRDRLITKEFESEVPVRCTLFVDTSNSVRLGPPGKNPLARLVEIAASIAQANASIRDLTGLCLFDDRQSTVVRPARTARHVADLLNRLADAAGLAPTQGSDSVEALMRVAYPLAEETYPDLMDGVTNHVPYWLPRQWPPYMHTGERPTTTRRIVRLVMTVLASALFLFLAIGEWGLLENFYDTINDWLRATFELREDFLRGMDDIVGWMFLLIQFFVYRPFVRFFVDGLPTMFSGRRRRLARWRKRLAALLALRYDLGPGGVGLLMEDNELFSRYAQQFLAEHHVPYQPPLYDDRGRYQFAAPDKIDILARAMVQAVGKGRDNEVFVLLVDLLELSDRLDPLLAAVRVAISRHHQVVLICPWPPGVPPPHAPAADESRELTALLARGSALHAGSATEFGPILKRLLAERLNREFHRIRRAFSRFAVPVVCAQTDEPIPVVLERLERARGVRRRR